MTRTCSAPCTDRRVAKVPNPGPSNTARVSAVRSRRRFDRAGPKVAAARRRRSDDRPRSSDSTKRSSYAIALRRCAMGDAIGRLLLREGGGYLTPVRRSGQRSYNTPWSLEMTSTRVSATATNTKNGARADERGLCKFNEGRWSAAQTAVQYTAT